MEHSIEISVLIDDIEIGLISKTFEGTYEEALNEIRATIDRNRKNNPEQELQFEVILDHNHITI